MLKRIAGEIWAFDAEWVPDPEAGRRLYQLPGDLPDAEVMQAMWEHDGSTADHPQPFLKLALCRLVSVAAVIRCASAEGAVSLSLKSLPTQRDNVLGQGEAEILALFLETVGKRGPQLVGFNSQAADLKLMIQRGIIQGISVPTFCTRPDKPWEGTDYFARFGDDHIDLQEVVSSFGKGTPSLHELAVLSGIPGKLGVAGDNVAQMWLDGQLKDIIAYNETDALTTYLVWLRVAHFAGFFTREGYAHEQELVRQLLVEKGQEPGYEHLQIYRQAWDKLQARSGH